MAISLTFVCDRCKQEHVGDDAVNKAERWGIKLFVSRIGNSSSYSFPEKDEEWCRDCCVKSNFATPTKEQQERDVKQPEKVPTIEDLIRDIAYDAASDALQNQ